MAKLQIVDHAENTRVPFLRGILTRSLREAGLPFDDAYQVASRVREDLLAGAAAEVTEVTTAALVERVVAHLHPFGPEVVRRYQAGPKEGTILVRFADGHAVAYSRGRHRQELQACGLGVGEVARATTTVYRELVQRGLEEVSAAELHWLTHELLLAEFGEETAHRYRVWLEYQRSRPPLILLVGGAPGCGKSTIATQVAHLLDIPRTQSTDMLREVMRMMIPARLLPVLHSSSFKAWERIPVVGQAAASNEAQLIAGYLTQTELLSVACEAVVNRAFTERLSLVLEGVHVHPTLIERLPKDKEAIVVPMMFAVLKPTELRRRIRGRSGRLPERRARRYLENFDAIWRLQAFLLSEADRAGIPIVANEEKDRTVQQAMLTVLHELCRRFEGGREILER